jgi:uncharacterized protein (DUF2236 family)
VLPDPPSVPTVADVLSLPSRALGAARTILALQAARLLIGDHTPARELRGPDDHDDPGVFGPDSVTWRLHEDACMIAGGLRALMLQTVHPLAIAGVVDHSRFREDPLGRLANTSSFVGTAIYGTRPQAEAAVAVVRRVHERVTGVAPDGRPYHANDPALLSWVHHTLVDSFLRASRRYGAHPPTAAEADRYVAEWATLAELFGADPVARSVDELRTYFLDVRPELRATPAAHDTIRFLLGPPLPVLARGPYAVVAAAAITMLPRSVRRQLRLPVPPAVEPLVVRPAATTMLRSLGWVLAGYPFDDGPTPVAA